MKMNNHSNWTLRMLSVVLMMMMASVVLKVNAGKYYSLCSPPSGTSIFAYRSRDIRDQRNINLQNLSSGKLTLIINVASFCGLTEQYLQMNSLLDRTAESKFTIVAYPCDQFGHQEPGANGTEILNGLRYVRPGGGFVPHPNIHLMLKGDVNGEKENPLYSYLKESCPPFSSAVFKPRENFWEPIRYNDITWNFEKFLVSADGKPLFRIHPIVSIPELEPTLTALLAPVGDLLEQEEKLHELLQDLDRTVAEKHTATNKS